MGLRSAVLARGRRPWTSAADRRPVTGPNFRIGPVTGLRSAVLARGRRPWANTADRDPVPEPIRNYLINDNFIN